MFSCTYIFFLSDKKWFSLFKKVVLQHLNSPMDSRRLRNLWKSSFFRLLFAAQTIKIAFPMSNY